jgi:hypothetical protein
LSSDSEEETYRARGKTLKSGIKLKSGAGRSVERPQTWAQAGLAEEFSAKSIGFDELDLASFVAGELEIALSHRIRKREKDSRLNLLKDLCYLATKKSMGVVKKIYASILNKVEMGKLNWGDDFQPQMQWMLAMDSATVSAKYERKEGFRSKPVPAGKAFWCFSYNKGGCSLPEGHEVPYKGGMAKAGHFCSACYEKEKKRVPHGATSDLCPYKKA